MQVVEFSRICISVTSGSTRASAWCWTSTYWYFRDVLTVN